MAQATPPAKAGGDKGANNSAGSEALEENLDNDGEEEVRTRLHYGTLLALSQHRMC